LAAPGAGLRPVEAWVSRHVLFPLYARTHPWERAVRQFRREARKIRHLAESRTVEERARRVLIRRIMGIEDSSRYWSIDMTLEHLVIVGEQVCGGIVMLSRGQVPPGEASTAAVKPRGGWPDATERFQKMVDTVCYRLQEEVGDRKAAARYVHPWFGALSAEEWVALLAMHQKIHRRQVERIIGRL
jgi:hypothetical protein